MYLKPKAILKYLMGEEKLEKDFAVFASAGYNKIENEIVDPSIDLTDKNDKPLHTRVLKQSGQPKYRTAMIRTNEWKLILNETEPTELYHMNGGWIERENVAEKEEFGAIRRNLERRIKSIWKW